MQHSSLCNTPTKLVASSGRAIQNLPSPAPPRSFSREEEVQTYGARDAPSPLPLGPPRTHPALPCPHVPVLRHLHPHPLTPSTNARWQCSLFLPECSLSPMRPRLSSPPWCLVNTCPISPLWIQCSSRAPTKPNPPQLLVPKMIFLNKFHIHNLISASEQSSEKGRCAGHCAIQQMGILRPQIHYTTEQQNQASGSTAGALFTASSSHPLPFPLMPPSLSQETVGNLNQGPLGRQGTSWTQRRGPLPGPRPVMCTPGSQMPGAGNNGAKNRAGG